MPQGPASPLAPCPLPEGGPPALKKLPARCAQLVLKLCAWLAGKGFGQRPDARSGGRGGSFLLAVSGGADSCALACLMAYAAPRLGLELHGLSLDHGLRPEAGAEAAYAARLCRWLGFPCGVERLDVRGEAARTGQGIEEAARSLRYRALERRRRLLGAQWTAVAHHRRDLAEDMLMRLVRGTGWPGLGGMASIDPARRLVRPLLDEDPLALRAFLASMGAAHCEDPSNRDTAFLRNRMRLEILPRLKAENPKIEEALLSLARLARTDQAFFQEALDRALAETPWRQTPAGLRLPKALLQSLPRALRLRLYLRALHALGTAGQARASTLFLLDEAWEQGGRPRVFELPGGARLHLRRGEILLEPAPEAGSRSCAETAL